MYRFINGHRRSKTRLNTGQTTSEFVGVFMVFLLVIFFPMLDMIAMAAFFGCGMILNAESTREASLVANEAGITTGAADATVVSNPDVVRTARVKRVEDEWSKNGFGHFFSMAKPITHVITVSGAAGSDQYVHVQTTVTGNPFLHIPFFVEVAGLNAPMTFNYSQERLIEQ